MKRLTGTLVAMTAATAAVSANAQSSVTLYGIVDNGLQYETGMPKGHVFGAQSGGCAQSRFGLKGAEDLGGGTKAIFQLESRLNTQNGSVANGSFFEGQATVGVQNETWGQLKFNTVNKVEFVLTFKPLQQQDELEGWQERKQRCPAVRGWRTIWPWGIWR